MPGAEPHGLFRRQAALAVRALRHAVPEACFALKGGTALNLFVRDMPRLSADIDLAFLPVTDRERSLRELDEAMRRIAAAITDSPEPIRSEERMPKPGMPVTRLFVSDRDRMRIKVEASPVQRGCVYPPEEMQFLSRAVAAYGPLCASKSICKSGSGGTWRDDPGPVAEPHDRRRCRGSRGTQPGTRRPDQPALTRAPGGVQSLRAPVRLQRMAVARQSLFQREKRLTCQDI